MKVTPVLGAQIAGGPVDTQRYGPSVGSLWRRYAPAKGITVDQALPTDPLVLVDPNGPRVRWLIDQPTGASCRVHTLRRVYVPSGNPTVAALYDVIIDEGYTAVAGPAFVEQDVEGDSVGVYLTTIAGLGVGESITAYYKPIRQ